MAKQSGKMEDLVTLSQLTAVFKGRKVFVTGHTGFKGSWLCATLHLLGANVKGYALLPENAGSLFNIVQPEIQMQSVIADIRDRVKLTRELLDFSPDFIFHLAAQPLVRRSYEIPSETFDINVTGTANVLEALKYLDGACDAVMITTDKVYENKEQAVFYKESDTLGGYDPYSASKACAELVVSSFRNSFFPSNSYNAHQKSVCSARAGNVIGGGDWNRDRIIPDIVQALMQNRSIEVRNPLAIRPWQHVLEPIAGYLKLAACMRLDPQTISGAYNFGPEKEDHLSVGALADIAVKKWGSGEWINKSIAGQPHEAGLLMLDISKAREELGWHPRLKAAEAVAWTIEWYKASERDKAAFTFEQIQSYFSA